MTTQIDRDAIRVWVDDVCDAADSWVTLCDVLGLDAKTTTVADVLNRGVSSSSDGESPDVPDVFTTGSVT